MALLRNASHGRPSWRTIQYKHTFLKFLKKNTEPILIKFWGKIEFVVANKKPPSKFKGWRVIEVHLSKIKNVVQISKLMKVKVKYVHGHLYIVIFGIYRWCQTAIPIFDRLVPELLPRDWTSMSEFSVFGVFFDHPGAHRQKFKILVRQNLMTTVSEFSGKFSWNWLARFSENFCWKKKKG